MSRVGRRPIQIPKGVTVEFEGATARVKGPKGELSMTMPPECAFQQDNGVIHVTRTAETIRARSIHGLARTLLHNMVRGVTEGFTQELEIIGVGFKAELKGNELHLTVGLSSPYPFAIPDGVKIELPTPTQIKVSGTSKELVGRVASEIRSVRPPEPYKGKGIKYVSEFVHRKAGKTAAGS